MRFRATILVKLLAALVVPVVALFTLFAFVAYDFSRRDLDAELGHRLEAIAASAATQIRDPKYLTELSEGDESQPLYQQAVARLAHGDAEPVEHPREPARIGNHPRPVRPPHHRFQRLGKPVLLL